LGELVPEWLDGGGVVVGVALAPDVGTVVGAVVAVDAGVVGEDEVVGSTTLAGTLETPRAGGVGSTDTQPVPGPRYTWGQTCASAPVTV
jgi:hypothetical protein